MLPEGRVPFMQSLEQWKQKSSIEMKIWLKANQEFIAECIRTKRQQDKSTYKTPEKASRS
eukprot:2061824-Ditylum_brightwellii.AAC.1